MVNPELDQNHIIIMTNEFRWLNKLTGERILQQKIKCKDCAYHSWEDISEIQEVNT